MWTTLGRIHRNSKIVAKNMGYARKLEEVSVIAKDSQSAKGCVNVVSLKQEIGDTGLAGGAKWFGDCKMMWTAPVCRWPHLPPCMSLCFHCP